MDLPAVMTSWFGLQSESMREAGIAALFNVSGVVITGLVAIMTWIGGTWTQRRRDSALQREKIADVQTALWAEVVGNLDHLARFDLDAHANEIVQRFQNDPSFVPFVPRESGTRVFDAALAEIHILPEDVIAPIVGYYRQQHAVEQFIDDIRSSDFATRSTKVRQAVYLDYLRMLKKVRRQAAEARNALQVSLYKYRPSNKLDAVSANSTPKGSHPPGELTVSTVSGTFSSQAGDLKAHPEQSSAAAASDRASRPPISDHV